MEAIFSKSRTQAIGLGAIAGMRAMSAPALLSDFLSTSPTHTLDDSPLHYLQNPGLATGLKLLAVAEMLTDKLPNIPDRISAPSLLVRTLSGALVGATISEAHGERKISGALLGGIGAIAASYAFFFLRKKLSQATPLPDTAYALLEDFLVISAGRALLKS
jgi:uncharacterized membrane protein